MTTPEDGDSDEDWENERQALARREAESRPSQTHEHKESEDEDDHGEFVYPSTNPTTTSLEHAPPPVSIPEENAPPAEIRAKDVEVVGSESSSLIDQPHSPQPQPAVLENSSPPSPALSPVSTDIAVGPQLQLEFPQPPPQKLPSPAQLESLYAAASSGDLPLLKRLFRNALERNDVEQFNLANDASTRTGFTALHVAASRGFLEIVQWRT